MARCPVCTPSSEPNTTRVGRGGWHRTGEPTAGAGPDVVLCPYCRGTGIAPELTEDTATNGGGTILNGAEPGLPEPPASPTPPISRPLRESPDWHGGDGMVPHG